MVSSSSNFALSLSVAMTSSGLWISTPAGAEMSAAVTWPAPCLAQVRRDGLVVLAGDDEALDVQDDLGDVFLDTGNGAELVQNAVDADARDGSAGDRGEQGAAKRVAEGVAEAGLQRLDDEPRAELRDVLFGRAWDAVQ